MVESSPASWDPSIECCWMPHARGWESSPGTLPSSCPRSLLNTLLCHLPPLIVGLGGVAKKKMVCVDPFSLPIFLSCSSDPQTEEDFLKCSHIQKELILHAIDSIDASAPGGGILVSVTRAFSCMSSPSPLLVVVNSRGNDVPSTTFAGILPVQSASRKMKMSWTMLCAIDISRWKISTRWCLWVALALLAGGRSASILRWCGLSLS